MPQQHVFVDETKTRGLFLTAVALDAAQLGSARATVRALLLPGQRRPHFSRESERQRKIMLDALETLRPAVTVYDGSAHPRRGQRQACLARLVGDLAADGTDMLVLERDEELVKTDSRVLDDQKRRLQCPQLRYEHLRAHEELLLSIPDAYAWCWQRRGSWKSRIQRMVREVQV